jgi:hypothetical protein
MNFSNKKVTRTFCTSNTKNAWVYLETFGWRKINGTSADGVSNVYKMAVIARAHNRTLSGSIDNNKKITKLYL